MKTPASTAHAIARPMGRPVAFRFRANMGRDDRLFRCILGLALVQLCFVLEGSARGLGVLGVLPIASGLLAWSPLYAWFGINTRRVALSRLDRTDSRHRALS